MHKLLVLLLIFFARPVPGMEGHASFHASLVSLLLHPEPHNIIEQLNNCQPDEANRSGNIPLHDICAIPLFWHPELRPFVYQLISRTANINHQNLLGRTPLHDLVRNPNATVQDLQFLIAAGARWLQDNQGNNPLGAIFERAAPKGLEIQRTLLLRALLFPQISLQDIQKSLAAVKAIHIYHATKIEDLFLDLPLGQYDRILLQWGIKNFCKKHTNQELKQGLIEMLRLKQKWIPESKEPPLTVEAELRIIDETLRRYNYDKYILSKHAEHLSPVKKMGRTLRSYHETMRALGYMHPGKASWQTSAHIPLPIDIAKKIALFVAEKQQ